MLRVTKICRQGEQLPQFTQDCASSGTESLTTLENPESQANQDSWAPCLQE